MLYVSAIGMTVQMIRTSLASILGEDKVPCDGYLVLIGIVIPMASAPICARAIFVYSRIQMQRQLAQYGKEELDMNLKRFEEIRGCSKIFLVLRAVHKELMPCNVSKSRLSGNLSDGQLNDEHASTPALSRRFKRSIALRITSGNTFGLIFVFFQVLVGICIALALFLTPGLPYGGRCFGCVLTLREASIMGLQLFVVVAVAATFFITTRGDPDPVGILRELRIILTLVIGFVATAAINFFLPTQESTKFIINEYISCIFLLGVHLVQGPLQILLSYETKISAVDHHNAGAGDFSDKDAEKPMASIGSSFDSPTMDLVMASPSGLKSFQQYLATELSVENLYFLLATNRYKEAHQEPKTSAGDLSSLAHMMYTSFIQEGSMLEVNISSKERRRIDSELRPRQLRLRGRSASQRSLASGSMDAEVPSIALFDRAYREISNLLQNDSFPRFLKSSQYKAFRRGHEDTTVQPSRQYIPTQVRQQLLHEGAGPPVGALVDDDSSVRPQSFVAPPKANTPPSLAADSDSTGEELP